MLAGAKPASSGASPITGGQTAGVTRFASTVGPSAGLGLAGERLRTAPLAAGAFAAALALADPFFREGGRFAIWDPAAEAQPSYGVARYSRRPNA